MRYFYSSSPSGFIIREYPTQRRFISQENSWESTLFTLRDVESLPNFHKEITEQEVIQLLAKVKLQNL